MDNITDIKIPFSTLTEFKAEWEKNISKGGIFTKADPPPAARQRVKVLIEILDAGVTLELSGEAVYVTPQGVGVQLDPLSQETQDRIKNLFSVETIQVEEGESAQATGTTAGTDGSLLQSIQNMNRAEKLAFARKGGNEARAILLRDRDPQVVMSVLLNPRLTVAEVIQLTSSQNISLDMIKYVIRKEEWLANEAIRLNVVLNPKTPLPTAMNLITKLSDKNIRMIAKKPLKQQLKTAALRILRDKFG